MPRDENHIISERPKLLVYRVDEGIKIPLGKIRTTDRSFEEHIADKSQARSFIIKDHVPRSMSRTVQHLQFDVPKSDDVPLSKPAIWIKRTNRREPVHISLLRHIVDPEQIFSIRTFHG